MAKSIVRSVDEYIAMQPKTVRSALERVRRSIRKAAPAAEEVISYEMPTYKLQGSRMIQFAVWEKHIALYAATDQIVAAFGEELARYTVKRGTIQFPITEAVPDRLIERMVKFRAEEIVRRGAAK